jgi:hypothetical protein
VDGAELRVDSPGKSMPTKGHVIDHIGFEIKHLEAFCKTLAASIVKADQPYSKQRHKDFASAELTDPWGTSIELTEGLNKFEQKCTCRREAHSRSPADEDGWGPFDIGDFPSMLMCDDLVRSLI